MIWRPRSKCSTTNARSTRSTRFEAASGKSSETDRLSGAASCWEAPASMRVCRLSIPLACPGAAKKETSVARFEQSRQSYPKESSLLSAVTSPGRSAGGAPIRDRSSRAVF